MEELAFIEAKLRQLNPRACQVLYWIHRGMMVKEIAKGLKLAESTVAISISEIYEVFDLKSINNYPERKRRLLELSHAAIERFIANPDTDCQDQLFQKGDTWPPPDPRTFALVTGDLDRGLLPIQRALEAPMRDEDGRITVVDIPQKGRRDWRYTFFMLIAAGILVALVVLIFLVLQLLNRNTNPVTQVNPPVLPTTLSSASGGMPDQSPTAAVLGVPSQIPPPTAAAVLGVPSQTPSLPTSTPEPQCQSFQFGDDFENGLGEEWKTIKGQAVILNGRLGSAANDVTLELGENLCNYVVNFDYSGQTKCRTAGNNQMYLIFADALLYTFMDCNQWWRTEQNGSWQDIAIDEGLPISGHLQVKVNDNEYTVLSNGKSVMKLNYGSPQRGTLQIEIEKGFGIDNFSLSTE